MKTINKIMFAMSAMAMVLPAMPAAAQNAPGQVALKGDVMVEKIITAPDGSETRELSKPGNVIPGERLIFSTEYTHTGSDAVANFVVTNPLPAAVRLAPDADPALDVSVNGGKSWGALAALTVTNPDGTTRPAAHADVTHIRWELASIAPGATGKLTYPAIIR